MRFFSGQIPVRWTEADVDALDYFYEEFNDPETMDQWRQIYGHVWQTGLQADFRREQPAYTPDIVNDVGTQGLRLSDVGTSWYKMLPGHLLPYHRDTYARYVKAYQISVDDIWRAIVFIQDWQPGFVFEVNGRPFTQYPAGTFVAWQGDTPHMAGNFGTVPRYTLQITGIRQS